MRTENLVKRLEAGEIVVLSRGEWDRVAASFEVLETHDTGVVGQLLIVRGPAGVAAVESPRPDERTVRPLVSLEAARAFVQDRLETYERMWDGCGCKVAYYT